MHSPLDTALSPLSTAAVLLWIWLIGAPAHAELCPPLFGEFECPLNYECTVHGQCVSNRTRDSKQPTSCANVRCGDDSRCISGGKCLPLQGLPCDRNTLGCNSECHDVLCDLESGELCRDGRCTKMLGLFCFNLFDCGSIPGWECSENRCIPLLLLKNKTPLANRLGDERQGPNKCDPGEAPQLDGSCKKLDDGCSQLVCEAGEVCMQGACFPASIDCSHDGECPHTSLLRMVCQKPAAGTHGGTHGRGVCVRDPCWARCPPDHACRNGECRPLTGLLCSASVAEGVDVCEAHKGFHCINGYCAKNECYKKVCQIGERCESGLCVSVEGRTCRDTHRDCGEAFDCDETMHCRDRIWLLSGAGNYTIQLVNAFRAKSTN